MTKGNVINNNFSSLPSGKRLWYWLSVLLAIAVVFICVDHWFDMTLTVWQSNDFLDCLFGGKITSFYEHTWQVAGSGGYCGGGVERDAASYSPIVYLFIGILILPIYLVDKGLGTTSVMAMESWVRLLMVLATFVAGKMLIKTFKKQSDSPKSKDILLYFVSSPIFLLSVLIMNQYDIIGVILCIIAFNFYIEGKLYKFAGIIAVAVGFKYFPLIMFFPLLLLREKRVSRIALSSLIAVAPYSIMMFIVKRVDPGYNKIMSVADDFIGKVFEARIPAGTTGVSIVVVLYCAICIIAYMANLKDDSSYFYWGARIAFVAYIMFFMFIDAHEQWFVYILPFMTLVFFTTTRTDEFMLIESAFSLLFYVFNAFSRGMVEYVRCSIMAITSGKEIDLETNLNFYNNFFDDVTIIYSLMFSCAIGLILIMAIDSYKNKNNIKTAINSNKEINYPMWFLRLATLLVYIVPLLYMYNKLQ